MQAYIIISGGPIPLLIPGCEHEWSSNQRGQTLPGNKPDEINRRASILKQPKGKKLVIL